MIRITVIKLVPYNLIKCESRNSYRSHLHFCFYLRPLWCLISPTVLLTDYNNGCYRSSSVVPICDQYRARDRIREWTLKCIFPVCYTYRSGPSTVTLVTATGRKTHIFLRSFASARIKLKRDQLYTCIILTKIINNFVITVVVLSVIINYYIYLFFIHTSLKYLFHILIKLLIIKIIDEECLFFKHFFLY